MYNSIKQKGKKGLVVLGTFAMTVLGVNAQTEPAARSMNLTLRQAIDIALAENPTIRVADKEIELKRVADKEAWQALLPTVDGNLALSHSIKVAEIRTSMGTFKMGMDGSTTAQGGVTVNLPLYAPVVYQNMKLTKEDIKLAQEKARGSRLDLINQVTKAYYGALLSADSYDVMQRSYNTAKQNFDVVDNKFKVGKVSEYDKIAAEVQLRNTNSALVSAGAGKKLALLRLKVLMGVTADIDININDSLKAYEGQLTLANTEYSVSDVENNSSLRQLDGNMTLLERARKVLHTNFIPTIGMQLSGTYQSMSNDHWNVFKYHYSPAVSLAFSVNIPIFHASNWTKLKSNKIQMSQLADTRLNTQRQLSMAAESYKQNMQSSIAQVQSNLEAVKQATKAVSISSTRYNVGHGTILELNQTEDALTVSELTYVQSIYDFLSNKADLDYTLGRE